MARLITSLSTTHEHPFFVDGAWRPAAQLAVGDKFDRIDGQASVLAAIATTPERHTVYNITVEEDHTYFVGAFGIWVHNKYWINPESPDFAAPDATPPKRGLLGTIGDWLGFDGKFGPGGTQENLSWGGFTTAISNSFHMTTATPAGPANPDAYDDTTTVVVITGRDPYKNGLILDALKGNGNKLLGEFMHGRWLPSKDVWTQNADTVSHYAPDVVALNYLADKTKTVPLVSTIARVNAAMAEGRTRGTLHFLINGINDINGIVKDPFGTAFAAAKGMVAGDIYMAKAYFGFANPLGDGYKLVKSAIDGENNKFIETYKTKGYYAAVVGGSADGTEFGGNVILTVAPGTDAIEGARIVSGAAKAEQLINGLRGADELADLETLKADAGQVANSAPLVSIGNTGYGSIGEFTDAATARYQALYDQGHSIAMQNANQGLIANTPLAIGNDADAFARLGLRDWVTNVEGLKEGPGEIIQINRRLYDPSGSGAFRMPDVYIPGSQTILDGSISFKTGITPQVSDFGTFSSGATTTIIRPSTLPAAPIKGGSVVGSYGVLY